MNLDHIGVLVLKGIPCPPMNDLVKILMSVKLSNHLVVVLIKIVLTLVVDSNV